MKWLLSIGVLVATILICGVLGFIVGIFLTPSLDEGSHGMFIPVMLGLLGCYCGIPVGLIVAIVWLVRRTGQEKTDRELVRVIIDAGSIPIQPSTSGEPNQLPEPTSGLTPGRGSS